VHIGSTLLLMTGLAARVSGVFFVRGFSRRRGSDLECSALHCSPSTFKTPDSRLVPGCQKCCAVLVATGKVARWVDRCGSVTDDRRPPA
jgi:hypothetical protein